MLEQAAQTVAVPDTGSLRGDLLELAHRSAAIQTDPPARRWSARSPVKRRGSVIAAASRRFWTERLRLDRTIVERAQARGEIDVETATRPVIEALLGPLYFRLLVTGEPLEAGFIDGIVDLIHAGCADRSNA